MHSTWGCWHRPPLLQSGGMEDAASAAAAYRVARLQALVEVRKLYRNLIRAQWLLAQKAPVYSSAGAPPSRHSLGHRPPSPGCCP